nr:MULTISPECIES: hypothetical protein [Rhodococcus erythropolis group]
MGVGGIAQCPQQTLAPSGDDPLRRHVLRRFDIDNVDRVPGLLQVGEQPLGVPLPGESAIDDEVLTVGDGIAFGGRKQKVGRLAMEQRRQLERIKPAPLPRRCATPEVPTPRMCRQRGLRQGGSV